MVILLPAFSQVFESSSASYVLPIAQCDLNLSLQDKGTLNAITFAGMISSGFVWGYICDVVGRKKVMIVGYLLDGIFALMAFSSQNFTFLLIAKFFGGFIINGPFSAATSYLSEFHSAKYRAKVQLIRGIIVSLGNVALPMLAWAVLPRELNFRLFDYLDFHSWNVFFLICSLLPLTSGIVFMFMPESPKFLMTAGRNEEALLVFQLIYRINKGQPASNYPIKDLVDERINSKNDLNLKNPDKKTVARTIMEGLYKIKPLFCPPYVLKLFHTCVNTFLALMSMNTLKLWLPQLLQSINDFELSHGGDSSSICEMLDSTISKTSSSGECIINLDNSTVYIRTTIMGFTAILFFFLTSTVIGVLGKKKITVITAIVGGTCACCIYFAPNSNTVLALSAIFLAVVGVCANVLVTITLEIFPTNLRAMALSLHLMSSRTGSLVGNMVFPYLLHAGCAPPFLYIGCLSFGCAFLSLMYTNTENKPLV